MSETGDKNRMENGRKLNALRVASLYVGTIIGAGFASGREIWQFFGVFEGWGMAGILCFALLFFAIGHFIRYIALKLDTNDMGRIIAPGGNKKLEKFVGYLMAAILANVLVAMTAAGSSLLGQQFGLPLWSGGIIIMVMVIITVLGDFERLSGVFKWMMPVLCAAIIITCAVVLAVLPEVENPSVVTEPSPATPNWVFSSFSYTAYNVLALVSIVASASLNAKSRGSSALGVSMGGVFMGLMAAGILLTVQRDMAFSQAADMPLLGYVNKVSPVLGVIYTVILFFTIYSAAAGNFYGFTTKIKDGPKKKFIIIGAAVLAYLVGLLGFKNIIKYVSPVLGYLGIAIILMLTCNFISVWRKERKKCAGSESCGASVSSRGEKKTEAEADDIEKSAAVKDEASGEKKRPFPKPLTDVTGGPGGNAILIRGGGKNVLHDCGMACFQRELIENIEKELGDESLDYIILSHSHYDHVGALPYILKRWPKVKVCAAKKAREVFERRSALDMIASMGRNAAVLYGKDPQEVTAEGLRVDIVLESGDVLDIGARMSENSEKAANAENAEDGEALAAEEAFAERGDETAFREKILCMETKGHTDCSMSYLLQPYGILLASESTGVMENRDKLHTSVLKSFDESLESARFLKLIPHKYIVVPHYGVLDEDMEADYFDRYIEAAENEISFYRGCIERGLSPEEILKEHKKLYWNDDRALYQPLKAYEMNTGITIKMMIKEAEKIQ